MSYLPNKYHGIFGPASSTVDDSIDGVPKEVAEFIIRRANGHCEQCDRIFSDVPMQISHTVARGMGGTHGKRSQFIHSAENLRYLCELCHLRLFHNQIVRYHSGTTQEISCDTCYMKQRCEQQAIIRGILSEKPYELATN
jgi:hypothetical protein